MCTNLNRDSSRIKGRRFVASMVAGVAASASLLALGGLVAPAQAQEKKPNIVVIMGDDIGWFNIGAYHRCVMSGKSPNLDQLASQGMMFTDS